MLDLHVRGYIIIIYMLEVTCTSPHLKLSA